MDLFEQRKKSILQKKDKASKGSWDFRAIALCERLNSYDCYYTTSSCSGKSVIMSEKVGKDGSYYLWSSHELLEFGKLLKEMDSIHDCKKGVLKLKSESPILFVCCKSIEDAKELLNKSVESGFKESGIKMTDKLIAVEIRSGEKIELPLIKDGKLLVDENFLNVLVGEINSRRERGWKKICKLVKLL